MRLQLWGVAIGRTIVVAGFAIALCFAPAVAQEGGSDSAGQHPEPLTIWIVRPATAADRAVRQTQKDLEDIKQYREAAAGNFGKPASETGQTAGSYGKPSSEEGKPASEVGQTAGSYGQTSGSLPSDVTSQTAGSYGQTAGSFGQSASSYTGAPTVTAASAFPQDGKQARLADFLGRFREGREGLDRQIRVVEIAGLELRDRLAAAEGKETFPDVLVSDHMPEWWQPVMSQMSVRRMADLPQVQAFADEALPARRSASTKPYANAYGLVQATHPEATREFLEWWFAGARFHPSAGPQPDQSSRVQAVAREAVATLLAGGAIDGMADPVMARFNASLTVGEMLGLPEDRAPADLKTDVAIVNTQANSRFAVVQLHAVCLSRSIYGELFPLVLLRANSHGDWRVLQITLRMSSLDAGLARRLLEPYARKSVEVPVAAPVPASPADGDRRQPGTGLRLAWDTAAEDGLVLVEWQLGSGPRAVASSIMLVSNAEGRAHAEATAPFANSSGQVRWRVWALGHGGVVEIGEWRTVEMR